MKGVVAVYYDGSNAKEQFVVPGFRWVVEVMQLAGCLPVRNSAVHLCLKNKVGKYLVLNDALLGFALKMLPQHDRVRTTLHLGSDMELQYYLRGHGVPIDTCPVDATGNIRTDILNTWFCKHRDKTRQASRTATDESKETCLTFKMDSLEDSDGWNDEELDLNTISSADPMNTTFLAPIGSETHADTSDKSQLSRIPIQPTDQDVLLGRGRKIQHHPGNNKFRAFLEDYSDEYDNAARNKRRKLCVHLRRVLAGRGIRFLEESKGVWVESDFQEAEKKIGQL